MANTSTTNLTAVPPYEVKLEERIHGGTTYKPMTLLTADSPRERLTAQGKDVLIIGGGTSGLLVAWMLLDKGIRVTILSRKWVWTKDFQGSRITSQIAGALWETLPGGCGLTEIESPGKGSASVNHYRKWAMQNL